MRINHRIFGVLLEVETYVSNQVVFGLEDVGGYGRALAKYLVDHERIVKSKSGFIILNEKPSDDTKMIVGMRNV